MMLNRESATPLHAQLEQIMRQKMASNEWPVGKLIPSENKISQEYGISRMTVRNVIAKLEQEGLVERVMGKGTYVSSPKMRGGNLKFDGIISQLQKMGYTITTKVLDREKDGRKTLRSVLPAGGLCLLCGQAPALYERQPHERPCYIHPGVSRAGPGWKAGGDGVQPAVHDPGEVLRPGPGDRL